MKKQEIVKLCLKTYRKGLREIKPKDSRERVLKRLRKLRIDDGVCSFLLRKYFLAKEILIHEPFPKIVREMSWIKKRSNYEEGRILYWTKTPIVCEAKKEIVESLKYRINILKSHLK